MNVTLCMARSATAFGVNDSLRFRRIYSIATCESWEAGYGELQTVTHRPGRTDTHYIHADMPIGANQTGLSICNVEYPVNRSFSQRKRWQREHTVFHNAANLFPKIKNIICMALIKTQCCNTELHFAKRCNRAALHHRPGTPVLFKMVTPQGCKGMFLPF